ncbi:response regulator [Variovorax rhizosphaerae]|uniref:Response regulator n=1 Tax=Variovorax rhizosphaerae TaxID=1836200 RepID=A0ABU8WEB6_9BURK
MIVVEDDDDVRSAVLVALDVFGFEARGFAEPQSVMRLTPPLDAHCLVLDIGLPGVTAFELYRSLCKDRRSVPAVFITGRDDASGRAAAAAFHGEYLLKPFTATALRDAVDRATAGRAASS